MSTAPKEKKPVNDPTAPPPPDLDEVEANDDETRMDDFIEDEEDED